MSTDMYIDVSQLRIRSPKIDENGNVTPRQQPLFQLQQIHCIVALCMMCQTILLYILYKGDYTNLIYWFLISLINLSLAVMVCSIRG